MTDRELMQQALEALEAKGDAWIVLERKARAALRERLAQPEMQPCAGRNCGSTNPNLHSAECFEDYEKATGMNQRKPLTDEELYKVFPAIATYHEANKTLYRSIARAIEAAHGIGEKPDAA